MASHHEILRINRRARRKRFFHRSAVLIILTIYFLVLAGIVFSRYVHSDILEKHTLSFYTFLKTVWMFNLIDFPQNTHFFKPDGYCFLVHVFCFLKH